MGMAAAINRPPNPEIRRHVLASVRETIARFDMIHSGESVLLGVSGGPDSLALLHLIKELAPEFYLKLGVAHLNHGLRKEADAEAVFVTSICREMGVTCHVVKEDVNRHRRRHKVSAEEAGRQVRYTFYRSVAAQHGYDKIALGHHAGDNAELVLMFLLRGSGSGGFSGIPPVRDGMIIRPLIRLSRRDITDYLEAAEVRYMTDRSNQDNRHLRNRIRNDLIPLLQQSYNPRIIPALNRSADILRDEDHWMAAMTDSHFSEALVSFGKGECRLSVERMTSLPVGARRRVIRKAVAEVKGDLRRISFDHVEAVLRLIESHRPQHAVALPDGLSFRKSGDSLSLSETRRQADGRPAAFGRIRRATYHYRVNRPQSPLHAPVIVDLDEIGWRMTFAVVESGAVGTVHKTGQTVAFFDMDSLVFPLELRNVQPGDRFTPYGCQGAQKVKKYFVDHKVSLGLRWECPVLISNGRIAWLAGHQIADACKVTPDTRWVLRAELAC
jgi:tRNA(Ile)-lysidine synthase